MLTLRLICDQVETLMNERQITTVSGKLSLPDDVNEVSICCHSDTPVRLLDSYSSTLGNTLANLIALYRELSKSLEQSKAWWTASIILVFDFCI